MMMSKRKHLTYGKHDRQRRARENAANTFAALAGDEDVSISPPTKRKLSFWSKSASKKQSQQTEHKPSSMEPSENDVSTLVGMGLCDADVARRYLKAKNNNVEQAAAAILDGEDITNLETSSAWDDSVWSADRSGQPNNEPDRNLHPLGSSTAPTRGPSPAGSFRRPGTKAEEDEDLAKAMAASQGDIRYGEQETGIINADGSSVQIQGPHLPDRNDPRNWALVRVEQTTSEIVPDVDAAGRRHIPGEPRFFKNTAHGDYLPSFLTICHGIPAIRELLLMPGYTRYDYGSNPEWWKGQAIVLPKVVHTSDGSPTDPVLAKYDDFIAELQRLMAFLDASNRTYGTTANLEKTAGLARHGKTAQSAMRTMVETFISELTAAAHSVNQSAESVEQAFGLQAGSADEPHAPSITTLLDFQVDNESTNLPQLLDRVIWDSESTDEPEDHYIETLPKVMVLRLTQVNKQYAQLGVLPPIQLYMDRYMKENVEAVRPLRASMAHERTRLARIAAAEEKLKGRYSAHRKVTLDTKKLIAQTRAQLLPLETDTTMVNGLISNRDQVLSDKLDSLVRSIEDKLARLQEQRTEALNTLANLSSPRNEESLLGILEHRYTLVGISTKPTITYLLRPREAVESQQMLIDDQDDTETPPGYQWWRTEYSVHNTTAAINCSKMSGFEALPAAKHEHNSALLVYASDAALDQRLVSDLNLPDALQAFVRNDNALFEQELQAQPPPSYDFDEGIAMQSIERKASTDSMRAEGGSDTEMDQDPRTHANYGLGYGAHIQYDDQPVVEIKPEDLDDFDSGVDAPHDDTHARDNQVNLL